MRIPVWFTIAAAIFVSGFGVFRIYIALVKKPAADEGPRRGLYRMSLRAHLFIGIVYLVLGAALFAVSAGWNPFGNYFAVDSKTPPKDEAPTKTPVPVDQLPTKK